MEEHDHEEGITDLARFSHIASRGLSALGPAGGITYAVHWTGGRQDDAEKGHTILVVVLAFACVANAGFAQTQATTTNGTQASGDEGQSDAEMAQEAINPFATSWLMQIQQNNHWTETPRGDDDARVQSNLVFQPLMSFRLTEKQGLIIRPMVTIVNSIPHFDQSGQNERTAGFGDTVLAFALPRSFLGGRLTVGAGPTFIFPTASKDLLSQDTWQVGPDAEAAFLGKNFITYGFVQQWFKVGGDGEDTNHMNGTFNFTYMLANGFTIGTQPTSRSIGRRPKTTDGGGSDHR